MDLVVAEPRLTCRFHVCVSLETKEMEANPAMASCVAEVVKQQGWGDNYWSHPIVKESGGVPVIPLAIYMDGVPFLKKESVLAMWVVNLLTGVRHLVLLLKKKMMCRCGCRGWCSLDAAFNFLSWSLSGAAHGAYPDRRHDGSEFPDDDPRKLTRGMKLCCPMAVVEIKGDWAEYAHSLGFPTWSHTLNPCCFCDAEKSNLYDFRDVGMHSLPWADLSHADYIRACELCERRVTISAADHRAIKAALFADKRKKGSRGRSLRTGIPHLHLEAGDRLEPGGQVVDVYAFDDASQFQFPLEVVFWRCRMQTITYHRNPLFSIPGVSLESLLVDSLHAVHLGIANVFCMHVLWELLAANLFAVEGPEEVRLSIAMSRLKGELFDYYASLPPHVRKATTEVSDFQIGMLGTRLSQTLNTKGMETKGLVPWCCRLLVRYGHHIPETKDLLLDAGMSLVRWFDIVQNNPKQMPAQALKDIESDIPGGLPATMFLQTFVAFS
jgi:hypothetical protein